MENKAYALNIYPKAQEDMENIFKYISEELCNPEAALNLIDNMESSMERICQDPFMCPLVESGMIKDYTLRKLVVRNYIIFYRAADQRQEIQVVRVLYGMSDYEKIL